MSKFEGKTLIECFLAGRELFKKLDNATIAGNDPNYRSAVETGIDAFNSCLYMIDRLGLFSANEEVEDIKTTSLKYVFQPSIMFGFELTDTKVPHKSLLCHFHVLFLLI